MSQSDLLVWAIFLVFVAAIAVAVIYQNKRRGEMLQAQADKRGGELVRNRFRRELHLPLNGNTVVIYSTPGSRYSPPRTFATVNPVNSSFPTLQVLRNDLGQKLLGAFGRQRVPIDDEDFDKRCVVRCDDAFVVQRILTPDVRQKFTDRSLRSMQLKVNPQFAEVMILTIPANDEALDNFIDTALLIFQKLLRP